eukprot:7849182-Alexandrium_andersonii.AAC.1
MIYTPSAGRPRTVSTPRSERWLAVQAAGAPLLGVRGFPPQTPGGVQVRSPWSLQSTISL